MAKFGDCYWILPTENGKWALIKTSFNVDDFGCKGLNDLTDKQREESDIKIFPTQKEANKKRTEMIISVLNEN